MKVSGVVLFAVGFSVVAVMASLLLSFGKSNVCGSRVYGFPLPWIDSECIVSGKTPIEVIYMVDYGALIVDYLIWFGTGALVGAGVLTLKDLWGRGHG